MGDRICYTQCSTDKIPCKGIFFIADEDSNNKASGKVGTTLKGAVGISESQPDPEA